MPIQHQTVLEQIGHLGYGHIVSAIVVAMFFQDSVTDAMQAQGWWHGFWMVAESEKCSSRPRRGMDKYLPTGKSIGERSGIDFGIDSRNQWGFTFDAFGVCFPLHSSVNLSPSRDHSSCVLTSISSRIKDGGDPICSIPDMWMISQFTYGSNRGSLNMKDEDEHN